MAKHTIYWKDRPIDSLSKTEIKDAITSLKYLERTLGLHGYYNGRKIWEWKKVFECLTTGEKILVPRLKLRYNILYIYSSIMIDEIIHNPPGHKFDFYHKVEKTTL